MKDNITPEEQWEFNEDVVRCFRDMLERSIPDYKTMRSLIYQFGKTILKDNDRVVDIGCSTGMAAEPFYKQYANRLSYLLCDNSEDMIKQCKRNYEAGINEGYVEVVKGDACTIDLKRQNGLVLSVLSLQFMATTNRQETICKIYDSLRDGGAFVFVEKVIGDQQMDKIEVDLYYDMKRRNGYTDEAIQRKRKSLENVLSPLKAKWNEDMMKEAGFKKCDMIWRCLNFCGWIAIK